MWNIYLLFFSAIYLKDRGYRRKIRKWRNLGIYMWPLKSIDVKAKWSQRCRQVKVHVEEAWQTSLWELENSAGSLCLQAAMVQYRATPGRGCLCSWGENTSGSELQKVPSGLYTRARYLYLPLYLQGASNGGFWYFSSNTFKYHTYSHIIIHRFEIQS